MDALSKRTLSTECKSAKVLLGTHSSVIGCRTSVRYQRRRQVRDKLNKSLLMTRKWAVKLNELTFKRWLNHMLCRSGLLWKVIPSSKFTPARFCRSVNKKNIAWLILYVINSTASYEVTYLRWKRAGSLARKKNSRSWLFEWETHAELFKTANWKGASKVAEWFWKVIRFFQVFSLCVWHVSVNIIFEKELFY